MTRHEQTEDFRVIGTHVAGFPTGIKEAFESLMKTLGSNRAYYGVSWLDESDNIIYYAMAKEDFPGEGKRYNYEVLTVTQGEYQAEEVHDWQSKTACIKDVFHRLMGNNKADKNHPCIEWYISDEKMMCMVKIL